MSAQPSSPGSFPPPPSDAPSTPELRPSLAPAVDSEPGEDLDQSFNWRTNAVLFVFTVISVFFMGAVYRTGAEHGVLGTFVRLHEGWPFAIPLLAILLAHEFGHWIAARIHGVPASLPYFIPLPFLSPFGTMGAVIAMRDRIRSRSALLDIGAAGPIAGMVVALPVMAIGLAVSPVVPIGGGPGTQEGQSLLYALMKRIFVGPIPDGHDVMLGPTALAAWAGFLVTMINLLPWGQLDGGHIAYALFGERQNRAARWVRPALLLLFLLNLVKFVMPVALERSDMSYGMAILNSMFWLSWFVFIGVIGRLSGGPNHPPTEPGELTPTRKAVAWVSLALFVLLFMPTPWAVY